MRKLKARRHHADHGVTLVIQRDGLIDNAAIATKTSAPEPITQHDNALLGAREHSSRGRLCLEHRKEVRRNISPADALRLRAARHVETMICISRYVVEDLGLL